MGTDHDAGAEGDARSVVLARIRSALGRDPAIPEVARSYRTDGEYPPGSPALLDLLEERLLDYKASVTRSAPEQVAEAIAGILDRRAPGGRIVVPADLEAGWTPERDLLRDDGSASTQALDTVAGVVTSCSLAIAQTGTIVLDAGPGQGRRAITLVPDLHVCVIRADQVVHTVPEALHLLDPGRPQTWISGPSATSDIELNPYTSMWTGVTPGDGPQDFHLVLLDNGRTAVLADETGRETLHCIRCSACLNVCPVYERTGGHAYGSVYPGPIGAILSPQLTGLTGDGVNDTLPYASSLCGACYDVCPVKIDIPSILVHLRARHVEEKARNHRLPTAEALAMKAAAAVMSNPARWRLAQRSSRAGRLLGRRGDGGQRRISALPPPLNAWTASRDLPLPPAETFREWWARERS